MAEILICQGSHHIDKVIAPAYLHLPGRRTGKLHRPGHVILCIFYGRKREISPHGHRTHLSEFDYAVGMPRPGTLQHGLFYAFRLKPAFTAPEAAGPVKQQGIMGVAFGKRRYPANIKAGQKIQNHSFIRSILKTYITYQSLKTFFPFDHMESLPSGIICQLRNNGIIFLLLAYQMHAVRGRGGGKGRTVSVAVGKMIAACMKLYQRLKIVIAFLYFILHALGHKA